MSERIFWRFRAHDKGTFIRWDDTKRLVYRSDETGRESNVMMQSDAGYNIDKGAYVEGMPIRVQFGEASRGTSASNGGTRTLVMTLPSGMTTRRTIHTKTGCHCITAITHANPRVALLTVHLMAWYFGRDEAIRHLQDFADGASSLQKEIELARVLGRRPVNGVGETRKARRAASIRIEKGLMYMSTALTDEIHVEGRSLKFRIDAPETVLIALEGRPLSSLVDHEVTRDPDLVIARIDRRDERKAAWTEQVVDVDEAIAMLSAKSGRLALAA